MLWMRLLHVWGNRSSFPTTSREPPIAPWLFGGFLSDERNKALCSEHSSSSLGLENCRVAVEGVIKFNLLYHIKQGNNDSLQAGSTTCKSPIEAS